MEKNKKLAAAAVAVISFIKQEEEMALMQAMSVPEPVRAPTETAPELISAPPVSLNLWGASGRQAQMQMRNLMQMKVFHN